MLRSMLDSRGQRVMQLHEPIRCHLFRFALLRGERDSERSIGAHSDLEVDRLARAVFAGEEGDLQRPGDVRGDERALSQGQVEGGQRHREVAKQFRRKRVFFGDFDEHAPTHAFGVALQVFHDHLRRLRLRHGHRDAIAVAVGEDGFARRCVQRLVDPFDEGLYGRVRDQSGGAQGFGHTLGIWGLRVAGMVSVVLVGISWSSSGRIARRSLCLRAPCRLFPAAARFLPASWPFRQTTSGLPAASRSVPAPVRPRR